MSRCVVVEFDDHNGAIEFGRMLGELVRCKECRHWAYGKDLCTLHDMGMMADDFCSYGEKNNE